eukprot:m.680334 g.680334  ORF g.680334 m.680334 type:complete len:84 (-) comp22810_c0_seq86:2954-3205(-)
MPNSSFSVVWYVCVRVCVMCNACMYVCVSVVSGDGSVAASLAQAVAAASTAAAKNTSGDAVNAVDKDDEELTDLSDDEVSMCV